MKTMIIPPRWEPNKRKTNVFGPNGRIGGMISGGNGVRIVRMGGALSVRGVGTGTVKPTVRPVVKPAVKPEVKAEETKPIEKPVEAVTEEPVEAAKDTAAASGDPWEGTDLSEEQKEDANAIEPPVEDDETGTEAAEEVSGEMLTLDGDCGIALPELPGAAAYKHGELQVSEPNRKGKKGRRRKNRRG